MVNTLCNVVAAREIFIREALVANNCETKLPFLTANEKLIAKVEELEHKSRRQDVLVDDVIKDALEKLDLRYPSSDPALKGLKVV